MRELPERKVLPQNVEDVRIKLSQWQGSESIGATVIIASQYAQVIYDEFRKRPGDKPKLVLQGIWDTLNDPVTAPNNQSVQDAWRPLAQTVSDANDCCQDIMIRYGETEGALLWHAECLFYSLARLERLTKGHIR